MTTMTVTASGQLTLRREVLRHLGIQPGDKIECDLLPGGQATLRAARPVGKPGDFIGLLAGRTSKVATLDEIDGAGEEGGTPGTRA